MIGVILADDHPLFRAGIAERLAAEKDISVIAEAADGAELLSLLREHDPRVVVVDLSMPSRGGLSLIQNIHRRWPGLGMLVLSYYSEDPYAVRALQAGAHGYLCKDCDASQLISGVRQVARGEIFVTARTAELMVGGLKPDRSQDVHDLLSGRELQVFMLLAEGESLGDIAEELCLSKKTVMTHKTRLMEKLGCRNIAQLVRYAWERGLLKS